ncbi:MAG: hypothetical protein AB7E96_11660 [Deferribacterales bacterium]
MDERRIQFTIKNEALLKTLMSLPKVQRGQFIAMSLAAYVQTEEGQHMLNLFGRKSSGGSPKIESENEVKNVPSGSVMGEFE